MAEQLWLFFFFRTVYFNAHWVYMFVRQQCVLNHSQAPEQTAHTEESTALSALKQHGCKQRQTDETYRRTNTWPPAFGANCRDWGVRSYLHCHLKLVQPLLLQLSGLKEKFKADVALLVRHVEPVAPLWISGRREIKHLFMHVQTIVIFLCVQTLWLLWNCEISVMIISPSSLHLWIVLLNSMLQGLWHNPT